MSENRNNNPSFAHPGATGQRTGGGTAVWDRKQSGAGGMDGGYGSHLSSGGGDYQRSNGGHHSQRYNPGPMHGGSGDHSAIIQSEVGKLLTWRMNVRIYVEEKQSRLQMLKQLTKEQDCEMTKLDHEVNRLKDGLEVSDSMQRKVASLGRQGETQNAYKAHLVKKLNNLGEGQAQESEEFKTIECDLVKLTDELKAMSLTYKDKEQVLRNDIVKAREERDAELQREQAEYHQLQNAQETQNSEIKELNTQLLKGKEMLNMSEAKLTSVQQHIFNLKKELECLKEVLTAADKGRTTELDSLSINLENYIQQSKNMTKENDTLDGEIRSVENNMEEMKKKVASNEEDNITMEKHISRTVIERPNCTTKLAAVVKNVEIEMKDEESSVEQLKIKQAEVDRLKNEYTETNEKLLEVETTNIKYQENIKELRSRKRDQFRLNSEVLDLEKQIYEEEETFRVKLQYAEANLQKVKREQDQRSEYNQEEIQILQDELDALTARHQQLEAEVKTLDNNSGQLNQDCESIEDDMKKMMDALAQLNNKQIEIDQQLEIAEKQQGPEEDRIARLATLEQNKQKIEDLKAKESLEKKEVEKLIHEKEILETELADLNNNLESLNCGTKLKSSLNTRRKMEADVAEIQAQIQSTNDNIKNLYERIEENKNNKQTLAAKKNKVLEQVNALRCEYEAIEAKEAECKQLQTEIEKCKMQQNCVDNTTDVSDKRARQQEKKAKLEALLKKESETNSRCQLDINALNATIARTIKSIDVELQDAKDEMAKLEDQLNNLEADRITKEQKNVQLNEQVEQLKQNVA